MSRIVFGNLKSGLLKKDVPYRVILPEDYKTSLNKKYPALYLLHGLFGSCDNWLNSTEIAEYSRSIGSIIVLVEGGDGWYVDSKMLPLNKFESYIIEELMPEIEAIFRVDNQKKARAVAGLSMGGFGAFKFALKRPDLFCFAASMSGAFIAPELYQTSRKTIWDELLPSINAAFGERNSEIRQENDIFSLIEKTSDEEVSNLPFFYFDCGLDDVFLPVNREIAEAMQSQKINFEYKEISGGHDWIYWDRQIQVILNLAKTNFRLSDS